jgi:O-acetyl-ADP-ribose deacetylase (regulator of RNase III)
MKIIHANLLDSDSQYIVHQCCCIKRITKGKGLAATMYKKFPHTDIYKNRTQDDVPGTVKIRGSNPCIVNLFGQFNPGKPRKTTDTQADRLKWFKQGLDEIGKLGMESISFPYKIGCGYGGGDWNEYYKALQDFDDSIMGDVFIYKITK